MEHNRKAETQFALIRWAALAVATLLMLGKIPLPALVGGVAVVAAYNGLILYAAASPDRFTHWGRTLGLVAGIGDIVVISLAIAVAHRQIPNLYLLYCLSIVGIGFVTQRVAAVFASTGVALAAHAAADIVAHNGESWGHILAGVALSSMVLLAAAGIAVSICIYKNRDEAMQRRDRKLSSLLEFGTRFSTGEDAYRMMEQILNNALRETEATAAYIMLVSESGDQLVTEVAASKEEQYPFPKSRAIGEGIEGYVIQTGKPLMLAREQDARGVKPATGTAAVRFDGEAAFCVPLTDAAANGGQGSVIGVLALLNHRAADLFADDDMDLATMYAGLAAMAIVNSRLYENLQGSFLRSLQALAKTLEKRDEYTDGHSYRVAELCVMLARKLRVSPDVVTFLHNGALLHDIGKIGIPDAVLLKPGRLTDEEFAIMKQHPVIGYEICQQLELDKDMLMLIRNHHERLDGTGYPDGLKLGELPLPLRIICVADAFDAMSSKRPYRKTMGSEVRQEQLNRFAGTQFDPVVVEALKAMLNAGELDELYADQWDNEEQEGLPILKVA